MARSQNSETDPDPPATRIPDPIREAIIASKTRTVVVTTVLCGGAIAQPVAAQVDDLGAAVCDSGAGYLITLLFIGAAVLLIAKGAGRAVSALDDIGSAKQQTREEGREEAKGAAVTFAGGIVGVPAIGAFLNRILPESLGCVGFDFTFVVVSNVEQLVHLVEAF